MAKQRVLQYQIEWDLKGGKGEAFFVCQVDDESDDTAIHRVKDIDDDSFEVLQHLTRSGDSLFFDADTQVIGTALVSLDDEEWEEDEEEFDDIFEIEEEDEDEEESDDEESEDESEETEEDKPTPAA